MSRVKKFLFIGLAGVGVLILLYIGFLVLVSLGGARDSSIGYNNSSGAQGIPAGDTAQFNNLLSQGGGIFDNFFDGVAQREAPGAPSQQESGSSGAQEGQLTERKITKNASLSLLVESAEETAQRIQDIAANLGGFVSSSRVHEVSAGTKNGAVAIRVPADRFEEAMQSIKNLASKVEREEIASTDVTEQFVDLQARLTNLRAEEERYLEIMNRAGTISETLQVSQQLSRVRGQIEQLEGQLQFLERQVDMSTITVSLTSEADIEVFGIRWKPLFVIKQEFRDMLEGLTGYINAMIAFVFWLPVLLLWLGTVGVIGLVLWKVGRAIWHKVRPPQSSSNLRQKRPDPSSRKKVA